MNWQDLHDKVMTLKELNSEEKVKIMVLIKQRQKEEEKTESSWSRNFR